MGRQFLPRDIKMSRRALWPNCLLKYLLSCLSPKRGHSSSFENYPCGEGNCETIERQNCLAPIFVPRHQDISFGPLGRRGHTTSTAGNFFPQSVSWNFFREYGWDPPSPIIQGIWGFQSISRILSPQYGWGCLFFQKWFRRGPLRAGHGTRSSTEGISDHCPRCVWTADRRRAAIRWDCFWLGRISVAYPCRASLWKIIYFFQILGGEKLLEKCRWNIFKRPERG